MGKMQFKNADKVCRTCGCILIIGENWTQRAAASSRYLCKGCNTKNARESRVYSEVFLRQQDPIKHCRVCGIELVQGVNWSARTKRARGYICQSCHNERDRTHYHDREKIAVQAKAYSQGLRLAVIERYGGQCACCGEQRHEFLCIDHINGGGNLERRLWNNISVYRKKLLDGPIRDDLRVLCHNCNSAIGFYGYCPHERERKALNIDLVSGTGCGRAGHTRETAHTY